MNYIPDYKFQVHSETLKMLDFFAEELAIPPMLSCLLVGGFSFANVLAYYEHNNKEPPKELVEFMANVYPAIMEEQRETILQQYIMLNTEGTA